MTVCVSVKVSEGLVLAADSKASVQGQTKDTSGNVRSGILKTYDHVRKLSQIKDYPIGTLAWGTALVGARSVESLINEYEYILPSVEEEFEKRKERRMGGEASQVETFTYDVKEIATGLLDHVKKQYDAEFQNKPRDQMPVLGMLVSGYSSGEFFPKQWLIDLPNSDDLTEIRPDKEGKPEFGANWFGLYDAIVRLHWGRDDQVIGIVAKRFSVQETQVRQLLEGLQYPVLFDGMPLQDAIDYAVYLINVVIGRFRFVVGVPLCGGEIDVAVIRPNSFDWIRRKSWKLGAT